MIFPSSGYVARLADAVRTIVETRDLCGDERQALKDWEHENGLLSATDRELVQTHVEREWRKSQLAAGAKILTEEERTQAHRDLNPTPAPRGIRR